MQCPRKFRPEALQPFKRSSRSVVFGANFEVGLAVAADGAHFGGLVADHKVTANAAFPHVLTGLFEDLVHFDVLQELEVTFFVGAFDVADRTETRGEFGEAFGFRFFGERLVHIGPFVVFAFGGGLEVLGRVADAAQGLEPEAGVFLFVAGGLQEDFRELFVPFALRDFGEVRVLVASLRFAREGGLQVRFGLRAGEALLAARFQPLRGSFQMFPAEVFTPYALLSEAFRILLVSSTCSDILSVSYQPYRHLSSCLKTIFKSSVFQVPYFQYF